MSPVKSFIKYAKKFLFFAKKASCSGLNFSSVESSSKLEGGGKFEVSCENKQAGIAVKMNGSTGTEMDVVDVKFKNFHFLSNPETDLPPIAFERIDEGVFAVRVLKEPVFFNLMAIPRTFKTQVQKVHVPVGAVETTGTFTGLLRGWFNPDDESSDMDSQVVCSFSSIDCPRKKLDLNIIKNK